MENNNTTKELLRLLNNKRSLKVFLKNLPLKQFNSIQNKVLDVISEIENDIKIEQENNIRKKELILKTIEDLKSEGIKVDEINFILNNKV